MVAKVDGGPGQGIDVELRGGRGEEEDNGRHVYVWV